MFTGIVEGLGTVTELRQEPGGICLFLAPPDCMRDSESAEECRIGDSVAINGCCLTVVEIDDKGWSFQAGEETLSRTNLGSLQIGGQVNLERSLPANGRIGGHFVQGHVDGVGTVDAIERHDEWVDMWFRVSADLTQLMVPKGSIAVDGVSLTLVNVEHERFSVALIPHTLEVTSLGTRRTGNSVNIEADVLGKYVQKLLNSPRQTSSGDPTGPI